MPKPKDELWKFFEPMDGQKIQCKFCEKIISGGITRGRYHLSKLPGGDVEPCMKVPADVQKKASEDAQQLERKNKRQKLKDPSYAITSSPAHILLTDVMIESTDLMEQEKKNMEAYKAFTRWALSRNIPLDLLKSPHFLTACSLVAKNGHEYEPLSDDFKQKKVISELNRDATLFIESVKHLARTWGCTLVMDFWMFGDMCYFIIMAVSFENGILLASTCQPVLWFEEEIELISTSMKHMGPQNVVQVLAADGYNLAALDASGYKETGVRLDALAYKKTGVFMTRICKSSFTNVISGIYATTFCKNLYDTCNKIVELLYGNEGYRNLMKKHTNGEELRQCHGSDFERQFVTLKLLFKAKKTLQDIFASEKMNVLDCNVMEVKEIIEGTEFWVQGKKIITSMGSLLKIMRLIDGYTSNFGYIYHAFLKAKEAAEVLIGEKGDSNSVLQCACGEMSKEMNHSLYKIGAYLNPHLFFGGEVRFTDEDIDSLENDIGRMMSTGGELVKEFKSYRSEEKKIFGENSIKSICTLHPSKKFKSEEKNIFGECTINYKFQSKERKIFEEGAIKSIRMLHPRLWWEKWGGKLPMLQSLAIKILSQPCYFKGFTPELKSIIQSAYAEKQQWEDLFLKVHSHLAESTARNEEADKKPIFWEEIEDLLDSSYMEGFDGVGTSVCDGRDSQGITSSCAVGNSAHDGE